MYKEEKARKYWSDRVKNNPTISAVLNIGLPELANITFDRWFSHHLKKIIRKNQRILDAGCGMGRVLVPLAKEGYDMTGVDLSAEMLRFCRENLKNAGVVRDIKLFRSSLSKLPFVNENFDVIILSEILFHLPDELARKAISECNRVLKSGGVVIVTTTNGDSLFLKGKARVDQRQIGYLFVIRHLSEVGSWFENFGFREITRSANSFTSMLNGFSQIRGLAKIYWGLVKHFPYFVELLYLIGLNLDKLMKFNFISSNFAVLYFVAYQKNV